jgi:antitoxin Xre/MbcA/ParS-like protein
MGTERREYDVVLVPESEGGYSVFVPDLPSVATQGETAASASPSKLRERQAPRNQAFAADPRSRSQRLQHRRTRGSHHYMTHPERRDAIAVPGPQPRRQARPPPQHPQDRRHQPRRAARAAVTALPIIVERLARLMDPAYIAVWLRKPVPALGDERPIDLIARSESARVERLISALEEAPFT